MTYILLIFGFVLLIKGADYFVDGASAIAGKLHVSPLIVGLTIVSLGTSAPEAVVSIIAALENNGDMVIGNVVGSNIINISLMLGVTILISPILVERETRTREIPFALAAAVLLLLLMSDRFLLSANTSIIGRIDGIILLTGIVLFLYYIFVKARRSRAATFDNEARKSGNDSGWFKNIVLFVIGLSGIIFGGDMVVDSASAIALSLGMSQALVGLTIVAIGTSLPELTTSISAARKGEAEMAFGNLIGSNIFNILFVLGISAVISPLSVSDSLFTDAWVLIAVSLVLLIIALWKNKLSRSGGILLVVLYAVYFIYIIIRG
ncbi:Inner membrane protein YrbG [Jeotgalicoccus saudimassiliensis]|uniref:Inner membrane protein YrbG n=1 Tax=Jeotgalicoccus saudimassiliensis TaxID=1461582 RepID=A0A078M3E3_9STAP|nr:calcium/sodium antiporter [Jeotgalicoccus saudimassiliensis]CDZ99271.1 Inner membrane protein YrbG [Jeotgalicoccus saudimassiliensis]